MSTTVETQPEILDALTPVQVAKAALHEAMEVLTKAKSVVVTNDDEYQKADAAVAAIKGAQKAAENKRTSLVKPLNDTVKAINADFKPVDAAFEEALAAYRKPMSAYQAKLAMERAKAEEEARKERERIAREEAAKIEAARKAEEEAKAAAKRAQEEADPFAAILAQQEAEEASMTAMEATEQAKQTIRELHAIEPAIPAKVTGTASKTYTVWDFEITDPALVPLAYRPIDTAAIARDVKAGKGECSIPGVRVFSRIEVK